MRVRAALARMGRPRIAAYAEAPTHAPMGYAPAACQVARPSGTQSPIAATAPIGPRLHAPAARLALALRAMKRTRPAGTSSTAPSIRSLVQTRSNNCSYPFARTAGTRPRQRKNREQPSISAVESSPGSVAMSRPSERTWRAASPAATAIDSSSRMSGLTTASSLALKRPLDLIWRAGPSGPGAAGDPSVTGTSSVLPGSSARSTPATPPALTPASQTSHKAIVCATALDPVLADRLANDVIRRIDRRARIERERRGP